MRPDPNAPWWARNTTQPLLPPDAVQGPGLRATIVKTLLISIAILAVATVLRGTNTPVTYLTEGGNTAHRQTLQSLMGACGPIYTNNGRPGESGPIPATRPDGTRNRATYRTIVPFFGNYHPQNSPPGTRFYTRTTTGVPAPETLLGWQAQGVLVAYYAAEANPDDVTALETLSADPALNLIVIPWETTGRGTLPNNRKIAYATWGATQTCQRLAASALTQFRTTHPASAARTAAAEAATAKPATAAQAGTP